MTVENKILLGICVAPGEGDNCRACWNFCKAEVHNAKEEFEQIIIGQ